MLCSAWLITTPSVRVRKEREMDAPIDVVVVDDEAEIVQLINEVLSDEGYRVGTARDAEGALRGVEQLQPAMLLIDYSIPGMNGGEVVARLRASGHTTLPMVLMSASSQVGMLSGSAVTAFLEKPFDLDALLACVARFIGPAPGVEP
jgi:CheY-like chemotaxis protein